MAAAFSLSRASVSCPSPFFVTIVVDVTLVIPAIQIWMTTTISNYNQHHVLVRDAPYDRLPFSLALTEKLKAVNCIVVEQIHR